MNTANIVEIYCIFDEFCNFFEPELKKHLVDSSGKRRRNRKSRVSDAEIMTMLILFHTSHYRDLKYFWFIPELRWSCHVVQAIAG